MKAFIYTLDNCSYCDVAKRLLTAKGIPFTERNITGNADLIEEMIFTAGGRTTAPQILLDDNHIGGCDDLIQMVRDGFFTGLDKKAS